MDAILYTDGHGTKVTSHEFVAGNSKYLIEGIVDARIHKVRTSPMPGGLLLIIGVIVFAGAFMRVFDDTALNYRIGEMVMTPNLIAGIAGFGLMLIGMITLFLRNRKYSVHIVTAEGERDPLVSTKKDYVSQVVAAINNAVKHSKR